MTGLAIGLPGAVLGPVLGRDVVTANAISSRAACPSNPAMPPAAAVTTADLELLGALGVTLTPDGRLLALTRPDGTHLPLVTGAGVDIGVPGLLVDLEVGGASLLKLRADLAASDLIGTIAEPVPSLLERVIGLDGAVVVELRSTAATSATTGHAEATGLRVTAKIQIGATSTVVDITDTTGTRDGELVLADLTLGATSCTWQPGGSPPGSWLDPTLT